MSDLNIKKILDALIKSDDKIIELQNYSAKDFSLLNQRFLSYHKHSKLVSNLILKICTFLKDDTKSNEDFLFGKLHLFKEISDNMQLADNAFNEIRESSARINELLEYIHIPLNNYNQNLLTLKLLSCNLRIDKLANTKEDYITRKIDDLILILENICHFYPKIDSFIKDYRGKIKVFINEISDIQNALLKNGFQRLNGINELALESMKQIVKDESLLIKARNGFANSQKEVETIITNLQYQDIIRQRIEHIQETHREMINRLKMMDDSLNTSDNTANIYLQIKDIVGLQSAHLLQINKEFHNAIETISETIQKYNLLAYEVNDAGEEISKPFAQLDIDMSKHMKELDVLKDKTTKYVDRKEEMCSLCDKLNAEAEEFISFFEEINGISKQMEKIHAAIQKSSSKGTLEKILALLENNLSISEKIKTQVAKFKDAKTVFSTSKGEIRKSTELLMEKVSNFDIENHQNIYASVGKMSRELLDLIMENKEQQVSIGKCIHELEYYKNFEQKVNEIIEYLDQVGQGFGKSVILNKNNIDENLEHIRKRYTTAKEHSIHDNFAENGRMNLTDMVEGLGVKENEDDDIEFF